MSPGNLTKYRNFGYIWAKKPHI